MTISSTTRKAGPYPGSGSADTFPFAFKVFTAEDLKVVRFEATTSTETVLALTTNYTVVLNADQNSNPGGSITLTAGNLASGYALTLTSDVEPLQETDLTNQGGFYPEVINDALDKSIIQIQQLTDAVNRSIKLSTTNTINNTEFTTTAAARASKVLGFDSFGELTVAQELGQYQGDWASGNSYVQRDFVKDPTNDNIYLCMIAHTATGTAPLSANPQITNWQLIVDAAAAAASIALASASAAAAAADAVAANASAVAAAASESIVTQAKADALAAQVAAEGARDTAITSSGTATTKAGEANQSAIDAAASAQQAAAAAGGGAIKITPTDTVADYLIDKIVPGTDIFITQNNIGGNESLSISAPYAVAYAIALGG
jgi:hypothetical protein